MVPATSPRNAELVIHAPSVLDAAAVHQLEETLSRIKDVPTVIDFSHVQRRGAFALAALMSWISSRQGDLVRTRGLSEHEQRLLAYLRLKPQPMS